FAREQAVRREHDIDRPIVDAADREAHRVRLASTGAFYRAGTGGNGLSRLDASGERHEDVPVVSRSAMAVVDDRVEVVAAVLERILVRGIPGIRSATDEVDEVVVELGRDVPL